MLFQAEFLRYMGDGIAAFNVDLGFRVHKVVFMHVDPAEVEYLIGGQQVMIHSRLQKISMTERKYYGTVKAYG